MIKKYYLLGFTFILNIILCQDLPNNFFTEYRFNILHDFGYLWNNNTLLKPYQYSNFENPNFFLNDSIFQENQFDDIKPNWIFSQIIENVHSGQSLSQKENFSLKLISGYENYFSIKDNSSHNLYTYLNIRFNKKIRMWLNPRITTNKNYLNNFSGIIQPNDRFGFNSGEIDKSGFGFFDKNFKIWYGRGRKNWGAIALNNLALSNYSPSFDHLSSEFHSNKYTFKYFHGFLETINENYNRYIVGKGIEYKNNSNLIIGLHEVVIYSGINRPIDLSYLNPVSFHLDIELNQRVNDINGTGSQNAIWQISGDIILKDKLRMSANFLIDEFAIDDKKINSVTGDTTNSQNYFGYQMRLAYSEILFKDFFATVYFENIFIGPNTLRHERGQNNFVTRNKPLGYSLGSDCKRSLLGFRLVTPYKLIIQLNTSVNEFGRGNLKNLPYSSNLIENNETHSMYNNNSFNEFVLDLNYQLNSKYNVCLNIKNNISDNDKNSLEVKFNLNLFFISQHNLKLY